MDIHCLEGKHTQAHPSLINLGYQRALAAGELTIILQNFEDPSCLICLLSSLPDVCELTSSQRRLPPRLCIHLGLHHKSFYSWYLNKWLGILPIFPQQKATCSLACTVLHPHIKGRHLAGCSASIKGSEREGYLAAGLGDIRKYQCLFYLIV